jgi:DNA polymerase phi
VQKNPTLGFTLVVQLTGVNGSRQFDKLTKTKTVESIFTAMDANGIKTYIEYLFGQVNLAGDEECERTAVLSNAY